MNYIKIKELIDNNLNILEIGDYGKGTSEDWILKAEIRLGVKFPKSFVWWLKKYNGMEINGEEVFSIYELNFDGVVGGDIVYINELNRNNGILNKNQIAIQENNQRDTFYFDLDKVNDQQEVQIFSDISGEMYAENFYAFLKKKFSE